jgi:hypothetical protein
MGWALANVQSLSNAYEATILSSISDLSLHENHVGRKVHFGSKCQEPSVSKSTPLWPTERMRCRRTQRLTLSGYASRRCQPILKLILRELLASWSNNGPMHCS